MRTQQEKLNQSYKDLEQVIKIADHLPKNIKKSMIEEIDHLRYFLFHSLKDEKKSSDAKKKIIDISEEDKMAFQSYTQKYDEKYQPKFYIDRMKNYFSFFKPVLQTRYEEIRQKSQVLLFNTR